MAEARPLLDFSDPRRRQPAAAPVVCGCQHQAEDLAWRNEKRMIQKEHQEQVCELRKANTRLDRDLCQARAEVHAWTLNFERQKTMRLKTTDSLLECKADLRAALVERDATREKLAAAQQRTTPFLLLPDPVAASAWMMEQARENALLKAVVEQQCFQLTQQQQQLQNQHRLFQSMPLPTTADISVFAPSEQTVVFSQQPTISGTKKRRVNPHEEN